MSTPVPDITLNEYAKGLFQQNASPLADMLAPIVPTGAAQFSIIDYAKRSSFQAPDAKRAIGGGSTAVQTDGEKLKISLDPYALHDDIDKHELHLAGDEGAKALLRQARVQNLVSQAGNSRLKEVLATLRAGVTASPESWAPSEDPVNDIDGYMETISNKIGMAPNYAVFSLGAWRIFKNHSSVKARLTSGNTKTKDAVVKLEDVGSLFLNPNTQCAVSTTVSDAKMNAAESKANVLGAEVWVYYREESANQFDASAFKTFRISENPFDGVRVLQKDFGERPTVEWTEAAFVNNADAAERLTVTA